jgi:hypothetical protein
LLLRTDAFLATFTRFLADLIIGICLNPLLVLLCGSNYNIQIILLGVKHKNFTD